jgi:signal transduction histidine kinase
MVGTRTNTVGSTGAGALHGSWRLLLLLALAVAVPTVCVLWFMNQATRNARLAVRQRLVDVYRPQLAAAAESVAADWQERLAALDAVPAEATAQALFARLVAVGACDSSVIYGESGEVAYPAETEALNGGIPEEPEDWAEAHTLEYELSDPPAAAAAYAEIAAATQDADLRAQAVLAQARCLAKAGEADEATDLLTALFTEEQHREARDRRGNLIAPLAGLRALELMGETGDPRRAQVLDGLEDCLNDYAGPLMPSSQRRFLMRRVQETAGGKVAFPALDAEELAAEYLAHGPSLPEPARLVPSGLPGVWRLGARDNTLLALFREEGFLDEMGALVKSAASLPGAEVTLVPPPDEPVGDPFLVVGVGGPLPDWRVALHLEGPDPFSVAAERQVAGYLWASLLSIGAIVVIALVAGGHLLRQARITRLKNDFIATVTHELKTPLSSIRLFAESLREGRYKDEAQAARYLELLVKENERLSRLIDNFLSFSRMERNRRAFEFAEVAPERVVAVVAEVVSDRFGSEDCRFEVDVEPGLPAVMADSDALVTVLLNLLDNAHKYTGDDKQIALRAYAADGCVCFEVRDNGIGMSRRAVRKVFDRFYQVDSSLSRSAGGCGLGLSIVKFIVEAHGGTIDVDSEPGKGSTFTVRLPAAGGAGN